MLNLKVEKICAPEISPWIEPPKKKDPPPPQNKWWSDPNKRYANISINFTVESIMILCILEVKSVVVDSESSYDPYHPVG